MTVRRALFQTTPEDERDEAYAGLFPKEPQLPVVIRDGSDRIPLSEPVSNGTPSSPEETAPTSTIHLAQRKQWYKEGQLLDEY
ncbi:hypothetical protein GX50_01883 [[Emmonsia] crescens]|uniref:Uncharacterized protein n=1 Tax=[Emmonsia] crescens TaxID=73230 RepID=A0A2B7ZQ39_9EURO|nr:hypothetical protein GX50_01883 [Emmonsia crescens]